MNLNFILTKEMKTLMICNIHIQWFMGGLSLIFGQWLLRSTLTLETQMSLTNSLTHDFVK